MKLSEFEMKVLGAIRLKADALLPDLAQVLLVKPHKVRYAIDGLLAKGIIRRRIVLDPARMGLSIYGFWFSLSPAGRKVREKVIKWFTAWPQVNYLGEFGGEFQFKADILAASPHAAEDVLTLCSRRLGGVFGRSELNLTLQTTEFPLGRLASSPCTEEVTLGIRTTPCHLDAQDLAVITALTTSDRQSHTQLAHSIGLPASTFEYRFKKLRQSQVIVAYQYWTQAYQLSQAGLLHVVHRLRLTATATRYGEILTNAARKIPGVYSLTFALGRTQVEICTATTSLQEAEAIMRQMEKSVYPDLLDCSSVPVLAHHKVTGIPPSPKTGVAVI